MEWPATERNTRQLVPVVLSNLPIVVGLFVFVSWWLASNGIYTADRFELWSLIDPVSYVLSMFMHSDWGHFAGNMRFWIPFGTIFTLLTSNRHLLLVAVLSHMLTQLASSALLRFGVGMSVVVFAIGAAVLVRSIGIAFQNQSMEVLQIGLIGLVPPVLLGFAMIFIVAGPSPIGHFEHFLGAVFGAAIEAMYVLSEHESETAPDERRRPTRVYR
jgi:membrane associated rhomboid family serine protease